MYSCAKAVAMREKLHVEQNLVIGHIGRFDAQKNHTFLLDIFSECVKLVPNAKLLLVGDGEGRNHIQDKVKKPTRVTKNTLFQRHQQIKAFIFCDT